FLNHHVRPRPSLDESAGERLRRERLGFLEPPRQLQVGHDRGQARTLGIRVDHSVPGSSGVAQSWRKKATTAFFSWASSFSSSTRLKNSTASSKVGSRPSWKYGGDSLMPRSGKVLIGPCLVATRPLCVWVL